MRLLARTAAAAGLAAVLVACSSPAPTVEVSGLALASPGCPVERPGETCPPIPVVAPVVILQGTKEVARVTSDAQGRFTVSLPAGSYVVEIGTPGGMPACPASSLEVQSAPVNLTIDCDSGIR